jgi:Flp pilus assembly protein TadD
MTKRTSVLSIFILALFACKHSEKPPVVLRSPNVLLLTIDTLRPDHLSCYGGANRTPNIDAIANQSAIFRNTFSQVPLTLPSHTAILTGLFPSHHGVHQNGLERFTRKEFLLSTAFHNAGYKTAAVVSSFVLDRRFGLSDAFDIYDDQMERKPDLTSNFDVERPGNEVLQKAEKILTSFKGQKWFVWLHFYDPHTPYAPPAPLEGYDGEIQFVDQQIGILRSWLRNQKLDQNLVVVVLGDHGESLGEHGEATHGFFVYNSTLKIPLMISYPGITHAVVEAPAAAVDVAPTLIELVGLNDNLQRDGESLQSLMRNQERKHPIYFESHYAELLGWNGLQGILEKNWKLISTTRSELYDWKSDGNERNNLYSQKDEVTQALKSELTKLAGTYTPGSNKLPDSESLEKLRSLGYISTTNVKAAAGTADPKDKISLWKEYERSLELKNAGKADGAGEVLKSLATREPKNNFFRLSLSRSYRISGKNSDAVEQLKKAIENNPSDADAFHELALAYKALHNYPEALQAEHIAISLNPDYSEYHAANGSIEVETGQFDAAKREFSIVLKIDPNNAIAWNNLGNALRETGDLTQAEIAYRKAIELSPHYAYPLNGLATVLVREDRTKEALPYFEKALDLDPRFIEVYLNLGIAYHTLGDTAKAKTLYETFIKLAPDSMKKERDNARLLLAHLRQGQ